MKQIERIGPPTYGSAPSARQWQAAYEKLAQAVFSEERFRLWDLEAKEYCDIRAARVRRRRKNTATGGEP